MASSRDTANGVHTIDAEYLGIPELAATFLIVDGDRAAFVENNTAHAVPRMLEALARQGLRPEQVEWAIVTHAHLDHAAGSSALLEACPNATLLCHPRAAKHLADPQKLIASATKVYGGPERFRKLYGDILPIPSERIRAMEDGATVGLGARTLRFFHTRGHANHHLCVHDSGSNGIFTGDAFGLTYPRLQGGGRFSFPTTSPTDYLPAEASAVVRQIAELNPDSVYLTHFGAFCDVGEIAGQLLEGLEVSARLYDEAMGSGLRGDPLVSLCRTRLDAWFREQLRVRGLGDDEGAWKWLELDRDLNAQGIAWAVQRAREKAQG